ncbi:type II 3-dehydroquinate dehydratase [Jeotgalibacillus soli]|uniref:3-dehydroquinate dehydratase n=1 Tax=Jeotgalibacillus soli TaxID=889306 RepID=A0A0C2R256_9BACL|nr:type II 3-dehydroquinate dehydratase [Jeotgalibacillus soli]KIL44370.1 3-dehydroquinate dehydratase [Jeotgalibacillus soli]
MTRLLLLNGPNLNRLGLREPRVYGHTTLEQIEEKLTQLAKEHGVTLLSKQSNHEGVLIDAIHEAAAQKWDGILFNPGAYSHTSIGLRDAIASIEVPVIEIHISNIHARESFRHHSHISAVSIGQIVGLGVYGYELALSAMINHIKGEQL